MSVPDSAKHSRPAGLESEVSRICAELDVEVAAFNSRDLAAQAFPYVFLDATYCQGPRRW